MMFINNCDDPETMVIKLLLLLLLLLFTIYDSIDFMHKKGEN